LAVVGRRADSSNDRSDGATFVTPERYCSRVHRSHLILRQIVLAAIAVTATATAEPAFAEVHCASQAQVFCTARADTLAMLQAWTNGDGKRQDVLIKGGRCFLLAAGLRYELLEAPSSQPTTAVVVTMANRERFSGFTPTAQISGGGASAGCRE
jgi:hypothetical protein